MNVSRALYPCPCCGYLVFDELGGYDSCPICGWEDDLSQLRFLETTGANRVSLIEAQRGFAATGAIGERHVAHVRPPQPEHTRDPLWRPFDPLVDDVERPVPGVEYGTTYPQDRTQLYYWRPDYWRKRGSEARSPRDA